MSDDSLMLLVLVGIGAYLYMQKEQPPVKSAGTKIGETIGTIAQDIGKEAQDIAKKVEESFKKDIKPFFDTTIPNAMKHDVAPVFTNTIPQFFKQDVAPVFTSKIPTAIDKKVVPFFSNVGHEIKKDAGKVGDAFKKAGSKIKSWFKH